MINSSAISSDNALRFGDSIWLVFSAAAGAYLSRVLISLLLVFVICEQSAMSLPWSSSPQTLSSVEGLKMIAEGKRLSDSGTKTALIEAIAKYDAAYELFSKDKLGMGMGLARFAAGSAYSSLGQKRNALKSFSDASTYLKDDPSFYALALVGVGIAYSNLSEWRPAIQILNEALALLEKSTNHEALASVLCALGATLVKIGEKQKSLEYLDRALRVAEESHDKRMEINARLVMGATLSSLGRKRQALETIEFTLKIARDIKEQSSEATSLLSLAEIQDSIGDRRMALSTYNQALQAGAQAPDWTSKGTVLNNMAGIYADLGEIDRAIALYEESIRISEAGGEPEDAASPLNGLASIYDQRAEPLKALAYYQRALDLARAVKHRSREAAALINIAKVYASFHQYEQALRANKEAEAAFRAVEDPAGEATALANLGAIYNLLDRSPEAVESLKRALELHRATENRGGQAHCLHGIGNAYRAAGDLTNALKAYDDALALMSIVESRVGEAIVRNDLGFTYFRLGDYSKASEYYTRALELTRSAGDPRGEATLLGNLGFLREKQGDQKAADMFYEQAIETRERVRTAARLEEFKTEVSDDSVELYAEAILLKMRSSRFDQAFGFTEKARARTFLDQLNTAHIDFRKGADPGLVEQEQSLRFAMQALEKKLREERRNNPSSEAAGSMAASLKQQGEAYSSLLSRLKASNPDYAELGSYSPAPLVEIQRLLGPRTTLVSYFVTAEKLLVFVVTSGGLQTVEVPVKEAELRAAIDWFRDFASLRNAKSESLNQLQAWLIEPIRQYIKTTDVIIVPHGVLHYVPFAALSNGREFFGDTHSISYLPSASVLQSLRRRGHTNHTGVLALAQSFADGLPVLRYVDREAAGIANLYHHSEARLTGSATKAAFLKRAGASGVVHIAAHTELNGDSPLFSRIALAPDKDDSGAIEVREIYGMDLTGTNLVVLSACQTQLGERSKGDDVVGLNRAFIYAGASSVIASLWTVDDEATSILMKTFYVNLKRGLSKAAALQAAQIATRKRYPHPFYWAAFVLTGDPGETQRAAHQQRTLARRRR